MADDLHEQAGNIERGRKQWKQTGLAAEKRVVDAESLAEKAKAKYESLAEQYDRVRTGDKQGGKFGLKGHKSAAQHEEELLRKVQNADSDYAAKVQAAQAARQELVSTHRPQAVENLQKLIRECDSGLTLQQQKFGMFYSIWRSVMSNTYVLQLLSVRNCFSARASVSALSRLMATLGHLVPRVLPRLCARLTTRRISMNLS